MNMKSQAPLRNWVFEPIFVVKAPPTVFLENLACNKRSYVIAAKVKDRLDWLQRRVARGRLTAQNAQLFLTAEEKNNVRADYRELLAASAAMNGVVAVWKEQFNHDREMLQQLEDAELDALLIRSC